MRIGTLMILAGTAAAAVVLAQRATSSYAADDDAWIGQSDYGHRGREGEGTRRGGGDRFGGAGHGGRSGATGGWRSVTILKTADEIAPAGRWPEPLRRLGDRIEILTSPAPGGRGTELAARLRGGDPSGPVAQVRRLLGHDPRQRLRTALHESKELLEAGEVMRLDPHPHGPRPRTPGGALIDLASKRSFGEGVL